MNDSGNISIRNNIYLNVLVYILKLKFKGSL